MASPLDVLAVTPAPVLRALRGPTPAPARLTDPEGPSVSVCRRVARFHDWNAAAWLLREDTLAESLFRSSEAHVAAGAMPKAAHAQITSRLVPFLLLVFGTSTEPDADARAMLEGEGRAEGAHFVCGYREAVLAKLADEAEREGLFADVVRLFRRIMLAFARSQKARVEHMRAQLCLPHFVPPFMQSRIVVGRHLEHGAAVCFPVNRLVAAHEPARGWMNPDREFSVAEWDELLRALPSREEADAAVPSRGPQHFFEAVVWNAHKPSPLLAVLHAYLDDAGLPRARAAVRNPAPQDLIKQMFTFLQPNWEYLWLAQGWPRHPELAWRMRYLREQCDWVPSPVHLGAILFAR